MRSRRSSQFFSRRLPAVAGLSEAGHLGFTLALGFALLPPLALLAGCGSGSGPTTVTVTGTVTMDGKPLPGANVVFHPLDGAETALASQSVTDADGRFELKTHAGGGRFKPGASPGTYTVAITKFDTAAISSTLAPPRNMVPAKYANPTSSGLSAVVKTDGENNFPFALDAE